MIKIFECSLCNHKGTRKSVRKHFRENHLWKDGLFLSSKIKCSEFK